MMQTVVDSQKLIAGWLVGLDFWQMVHKGHFAPFELNLKKFLIEEEIRSEWNFSPRFR